ncbi:MAG: hypothetical protein KIS66_06650 [Fimbriimonadaceae bacterium]|nr:hypothetical protein [Fimbriimonadaceae bacterium]
MTRRLAVLSLLLVAGSLSADLTTPKAFLGHDVCEDYQLANYRQLVAYWRKLETESKSIRVVSIGKTEEGRDQFMAIVSDPANLRNLETHRRNSERLAMARDLSEAEARILAAKAKAVVWIDGGLHATEVLGAQQLIEQTYQLLSRKDEENRRILKDVVILIVHANPDGMDLVSDWYMRKPDPKTRSLANLPVLYQKYAGHDNNRDFYASNLAETRNMNRVLYAEWFPQIVYNHHQSAPAGTIMYIPPFRNPYNYHVDPLVQIGTDLVGVHMHKRLIAEDLGGTVMREGASFSAWWNGGLRTTTYFHNMVGILTETWGSPSPTRVPFSKDRQIPTTDLPKPVDVREWRLKDSLRYEIEANYAILDYASRYRERLLFDTYRAAKNSILRGSKDNWTRYPARIAELGEKALSEPSLRDARMYVIPSDQPDFATAAKLVEKLRITGVEVHRLTREAGGFPAGSFVVRCDQPFRPHVLDMFEPQDHPNDFQYPGGPPIRPYDNAGYTLAYQMGVAFQRVLEPLDLPLEPVTGLAYVKPSAPGGARALVGRAEQNDSFAMANRAFSLGLTVKRDADGTWIAEGNEQQVRELANALNSGAFDVRSTPFEGGTPVAKPRVGLWDRYGGSMESGWLCYTLEQFAFDFTVVYAPDLDAGDLRSRFDVLVFPSGAIPAGARGGPAERQAEDETIPETYRRRMGAMTAERTIPKLREFVEQGGRLLAIGSSALNVARLLDLPVESALVERDESGRTRPLPNTRFYIPGSVLRMRLVRDPLTLGMPEEADAMFDGSPSFRVREGSSARVVAFYDTDKPLRSGWAWGQEVLKDTAAVVDAPLGRGRVVLYGPEIAFRGQPHGTFKLLFNGILGGA